MTARVPDADLVRACIAGEREAWAELHRRYHALVAQQCSHRATRLGYAQDVADEALQAFWLAFPRMVRAWDPSKGASLSTWLSWRSFHAFDRFLTTHLRAYSCPNAELFESGRPATQNPEEQLASAEISARVREAAAPTARSERERTILEGRFLADPPETLQAIAARYGVTRQAIEDQQRKLLGRLTSALLPLAA